MQQKGCSNQKIEENKSGLEFNILLKSKCASLNFDFWFLTEPYWSYYVDDWSLIIQVNGGAIRNMAQSAVWYQTGTKCWPHTYVEFSELWFTSMERSNTEIIRKV